jgi:hypothetical protein
VAKRDEEAAAQPRRTAVAAEATEEVEDLRPQGEEIAIDPQDVDVGQTAKVVEGDNAGTEGFIDQVLEEDDDGNPTKVLFVKRNSPGERFEEDYENVRPAIFGGTG